MLSNIKVISCSVCIISLLLYMYYRGLYVFIKSFTRGKRGDEGIDHAKKRKLSKVFLVILCISSYVAIMYGSVQEYYYMYFIKSPYFDANRVEYSMPYDLVVPEIREGSNLLWCLVCPNRVVDFTVKENTGTTLLNGSEIRVDRLSKFERCTMLILNIVGISTGHHSYNNLNSEVKIIDDTNKCIYIFQESDLERVEINDNDSYYILYAENSGKVKEYNDEDYKYYRNCLLGIVPE